MNRRDFGQPWIPTGERSGLLARIAATEMLAAATVASAGNGFTKLNLRIATVSGELQRLVRRSGFTH